MVSRPHVLVNMAMTADGKADTAERRGARISSPADESRVQQLRAECDAVMVGGRTLLAEDPRLTVRSAQLVAERAWRGMADQPMKVGVVSAVPGTASDPGIGRHGRFLGEGGGRVTIFTTSRTDNGIVHRLRSWGADVVVAGDARVDLLRAMVHLDRVGVRRLMVEGGGTLVAALLEAGLVDELRLYVAPVLFGGRDAPSPVAGPGFGAAAIRLGLSDVERLEDDGVALRYLVHARAGGAAGHEG